MSAFDQLSCTEMEMKVLSHQASLSVEDHRKNEQLSMKQEINKPLNAQYVGPDDVN